MRAPTENDSSGKVIQLSMQIASRVSAEEDVKILAGPTLAARADLQLSMQARNRAYDETFMAEGVLNAAERRTERELVLFGQRMQAQLGNVDVRGEKTQQFQFIFAKKAPSTMLPAGRDARTLALDAIEKRVANVDFAGPQAKTEFEPLGVAIAAERRALEVRNAKQELLSAAILVENNARQEVVIAVRAMANDVQSYYAKTPATARRVLGYGNAALTRKRNAAANKARGGALPDVPALPAHDSEVEDEIS